MLMLILECVAYFFAWTFIIYWIHRIGHKVPLMMRSHRLHHKFVRENTITWHWTNIFLFNDDWGSTIDFWITEIIPTAIFVFVTEQWWLGIGFYLYAAFLQEWFEHNVKFDAYPFYTSGQWHVMHHTHYPCNYGIGTPFWDWVFNTNKSPA